MAAGVASNVWMRTTSDDSLALRHSIFGHRGAGGGEEEGNAASVSFARGGAGQGDGEDGDQKILREVLKAAAGLSKGMNSLASCECSYKCVRVRCACIVCMRVWRCVRAHAVCERDCV